jgi:hypothetical protein|tara:strand:- start:657 stop:1034 length:378 start_codon:yes stop_codon:yes gene_type:complete
MSFKNIDHNKYRLGAYGSTLLSGTAGIDLTGSSAKVYVCAITTLTDYNVESTFSALESLNGEVGCISSVTAENDLDGANGVGAAGNGVDLDNSILFPPGVTIYGKWDKVTMASGACIVYFAPKGF